MRQPYYVIDAFTSEVFGGNPAGVCPLERWPDESLLQSIAAENNLSETAFFVREGDGWALRWFTPTLEIDLCGHATLASAHVVFAYLEPEAERAEFSTRSGRLSVLRGEQGLLTLDFPSRPGEPVAASPALAAALGAEPAEVLAARDLMAVFETEAQVRALAPDFAAMARIDTLGVIATAPGDDAAFVSRFFAPRAGVDEDPVTGSSHCTLVPYWSRRLGKPELRALQVSARGGELFCEDRGERVAISGRAALYLEGTIHLPE